jgi:hypothetical protein
MELIIMKYNVSLLEDRKEDGGQGKDYPGDFKRLDIDFLGICDI